MSETYYKIKRAGNQPKTTWIGSASCSRKFDPEQDTFIVSEQELGICIHNGNFKLVGPAPENEILSPVTQPESAPELEPEPESVEEEESEPEQNEETEEE